MKKTLSLFLLLAIIALGSCKKSCNFAKYEDGKYCTDIREGLIGSYHGTSIDTFAGAPNPMLQDVTLPVREGYGNYTNLIINGVNSFIDAEGNITVPNQGVTEALYEPYHVSGSGFIGDTTVGGVTNKYLTLRL